jgi:diguanylate cyclase (GGDEF)-like protein
MRPSRDRWGALALAGAGFCTILLVSGGTGSPLLPLLALAVVLASLWSDLRSALVAGAACAGVLLVAAMLLDGATLGDVVRVTSAFAAGALPASFLMRAEHRAVEGTGRLERILTEAKRGAPAEETEAVLRIDDLEIALARSCDELGALRGVLWDVQDEARLAVARAVSDAGPGPPHVPLAGHALGWVWNEGTPVRIEQPEWTEPDRIAYAARVGNHAAGALLTLEFDAGARIDPAAIDDAAADVNRVRVLHEAHVSAIEERRRATLLVETLRRLPAQLEPEAFAYDLIAVAVEIVGGTGGAVATWSGEEGTVLSVAGADGGPAAGTRFDPVESEFALAARGGATIVRSQLDPRSELAIATLRDAWTLRPRSVAVLPLLTTDGVIGVLGVWRSGRGTIDVSAIPLLETIAAYAGLHLKHALEFGLARENAETDALTTLPNRRAFESAWRGEIARHERYAQPVSLVLLDIDHFKQINDRWGHDAGDEVLRSVAQALRHGIRDVDLPARLGGEEFVVLLPETTFTAASEAAERLRSAIELLHVRWLGQTIPVRVSIGVSACPTSVASPADLLHTADTALYEAKRTGRNRVVAAPSRA